MVMRMMLLYGEIAGCQGYQKIDRFTKQGGPPPECNTVQYSGIQWNTVQYSALQCNSVQSTTISLYYLSASHGVLCSEQRTAKGNRGEYWA